MTQAAQLERESKAFYRAQFGDIRLKLAALDEFSPIRLALTRSIEIAAERVELSTSVDLAYDSWRPPLVGLAEDLTSEELAEFDSDLDLVLTRTREEKNRQQLLSLLNVENPERWKEWHGSLFELSIKSRLLRQSAEVEFDVALPNGRDVDVSLSIGARRLFLECTVLTQSESDSSHWRELFDNKKTDPEATGFRAIDLPRNVRRVLLKVFDKLAKRLDLEKHQQALDAPNLLLLGFPSPIDIGPRSHEVNWAFNELFRDERITVGRANAEFELSAVLTHHAATLFGESSDEYKAVLARIGDFLETPKRLGAALLFDRYVTSSTFVNPCCHAQHEVTDDELETVNTLMRRVPSWSHRIMTGP